MVLVSQEYQDKNANVAYNIPDGSKCCNLTRHLMKKPEINSDGWRKYYKLHRHKTFEGTYLWLIAYNEDSETPNRFIDDYGPYRTEMHAERGVRRLYRKVHGQFESIVLGAE